MSTQQIAPETAPTLDLAELVASNIRAYTARLNWNQSQLAAAIGMKQPTVNLKWHQKREWQLSELPRVAAALGVSVAQLVTPPPGYAEWVAEMNNSPAGGSHQTGSVARSKGLEPPTF